MLKIHLYIHWKVLFDSIFGLQLYETICRYKFKLLNVTKFKTNYSVNNINFTFIVLVKLKIEKKKI